MTAASQWRNSDRDQAYTRSAMSKRMDVGRSWRTDAKHDLMYRIVGQEIGAAPYLRFQPRISRNVLIDLNAGDAAGSPDGEWHRTCSPGMLAYNATKARLRVGIVLHEIDAAVYERLLQNLEQRLPELGYTQQGTASWTIADRVRIIALNQDGNSAAVDYIRPDDAVLVLHDPNAITDWSMRATLAQELQDKGVKCARALSTLSSNACGLKRGYTYDDRAEWFHLLTYEERSLPSHRDLLLAAIDRDSHQWAYLICTADKWKTKTETEVRRSFRKINRTVTMAWRRSEPDRFREIKRKLFLTRAERHDQDNPQLPIGDL